MNEGLREPVKKKIVENSTLRGKGEGKNKVVFKMQFKPFQAILDHVFLAAKAAQ